MTAISLREESLLALKDKVVVITGDLTFSSLKIPFSNINFQEALTASASQQ